jgi:transcriptional regulator with XRE-family HTH domain
MTRQISPDEERYILGKPCVFRKLLKQHRNKQRWSQERLALESNMDNTLVSRLESGQRPPTYTAVIKLGKGLCLSELELDELLIAAGYFPVHPEYAILDFPVLVAAFQVLSDGSIPSTVRAMLTQIIESSTMLARTESEAINSLLAYRRAP